MTRALPLAIVALAATAGGAATPDRPVTTAAGPPVQCIPIIRIRQSRVRSDRVIDFMMKDGRIFRNMLPADCPGLGYERRIAYATPLSQLCTADHVTAITSGPIGRGATCALGPFQPVTSTVPRRPR